VCTHGRHDTCCAELGRPLAAALTAARPEHTWECSHIGGDRFAANLLVLPDGLCYGRVPPSRGPGLVREHLAGRVDLDHLRGRSGLAFATQAAEWHLRHRLGLTGVHDVVLESDHVDAGTCTAVFAVRRQRRWRVVVRVASGPLRQLTCGSDRLRRALELDLLSIEPVDAANAG
ncbi:MAG: sucrase ferredoxin, partial [Actinomycetota bacterium]|nr:sucrase ferredoxin [Actinomycetota bacterium]